MPDSTVEIDFFQRERQKYYCSPPRRSCSERAGSSCRRIQNVVSRINPVLLRTVMAGEAAAGAQACCADSTGLWNPGRLLKFSHLPSPSAAPETGRTFVNLTPRSAVGGHPETAPLTIFYNGVVTAFVVTSDEAEAIIKMAEGGLMVEQASAERRPEESLHDHHPAEGDDLPIARKKSLQRFLEKRKERCKAPAAEPSCSSLSPQGAFQRA